MKATLKGGDEYDAFSKTRRIHHWAKGSLKKIKRRFWKRQRKAAKMES